jgi:hypothetical protein
MTPMSYRAEVPDTEKLPACAHTQLNGECGYGDLAQLFSDLSKYNKDQYSGWYPINQYPSDRTRLFEHRVIRPKCAFNTYLPAGRRTSVLLVPRRSCRYRAFRLGQPFVHRFRAPVSVRVMVLWSNRIAACPGRRMSVNGRRGSRRD